MGGSGGGSSGRVDYPDYMKEWHEDALFWGIAPHVPDVPDVSLTAAINAMTGNSPYTGEVAYDPDNAIADFMAEVAEFKALVDAIDVGSGGIGDDASDAFASRYDDDLVATVYPRFEGGMRDLNAVESSSFVIGRALIEDGRNKEVAQFDANLRLSLVETAAKYKAEVTRFTIEANRIKIVAKKEEQARTLELYDLDAKWDAEAFQYGANMLAAIAGTATAQGVKGPSQAQSAIGGALSGAAMGGMVSPTPMGVGIGAALGLGASFL